MTRRTRRSRRHLTDDDGFVELETMFGAVMIVSALSALLMASVFVNSQLAVSNAAHAAARAASLERSTGDATAAAQSAAGAALGDRVICEGMTATVNTGRFEPGGVVTVEVRCQVPWLGAMPRVWVPPRTASSQASSPIEAWKAQS